MMEFVSPQFEKLNYFLLMCALVAALIGMFIIWDVSALSLNEIKQWDCCTNYTIVNNTFTNTTFNNNGTSSHNLLLNLTSYDDHSQYAYLNGRDGGQVLNGGINYGNLSLNGSLNNGNILLNVGGGNVAIGNDSPSGTRLKIMRTGSNVGLTIESSTSGIQSDMIFSNPFNNINSKFIQFINLNDKFQIRTINDGQTAVVFNSLTINANNSKVGINTTSPQTNLDINADTSQDYHSGFQFLARAGVSQNRWLRFSQISQSGFSIQGFGLGANEAAVTDTKLFLQPSGGNVSVGTLSPTAQFHTTGTVRFSNLGAGTVTTDANGYLTTVSDSKAKTNIIPFTSSLIQIQNLNPVSYHYSKESGLDTQNVYVGFIAQDVEKVIPDAVKTKDDVIYITSKKSKVMDNNESEYETIEVKTGTQTKSLDDRAIIAALVNGMKEQQKEIDNLELRINKLEGGKV